MNTQDLEQKLKNEFEKVIENPTDKRIKRYREVENALLALWAKELFSNLIGDINDAIQTGKTNAINQLRKKGFKKKLDNARIYQMLSDAKKQQVKMEIERVITGVKLNSRRNISEMRNAFILEKKKLATDFLGTFKKYGVAYFVDRGGARWTLDRYINMLSTQTIISAKREAYFTKSLEWGNDLVRILHLGTDHEPCPLCEPFEGKVLSLTGKTRGYMTISEAENLGLFHINCDHAMELAPQEITQEEKEVEPDEDNLKYEQRNKY
jgi:hypothetical protein